MRFLLVLLGTMGLRLAVQAQPAADPSLVPADSLAMDSFFRMRGIDLTLCDHLPLYYEIYGHYGTCYRYNCIIQFDKRLDIVYERTENPQASSHKKYSHHSFFSP